MMQQFLVVLTETFESTQGTLFACQNDKVVFSFPVVIGKKGMAWGRGEHAYWMLPGLHKAEGDSKTPAGLFTLGTAFGKKQPQACHLPFLEVTPSLRAVDDPKSRFYNTIVCTKSVMNDWSSAETMLRDDHLYDLGIAIDHNANPVTPGRGSCIFLHLWRSSTSGTEGCTAMDKRDMIRLFEWLSPKTDPLLIQLPRVAYPSFLSSVCNEPIKSTVTKILSPLITAKG